MNTQYNFSGGTPAQIAQCESAIETAKAQHDAAIEKANVLKERIAALSKERAQIIANRVTGVAPALPDDVVGGRLALVAADLSGLEPLLSAAQAEANSHDSQPLKNRLTQLKLQWDREVAAREQYALLQKADELENLFLGCVKEIHNRGITLGKPLLLSSWRPSRRLQWLLSMNQVLAAGGG